MNQFVSIVLYDLPTKTSSERKTYRIFRKDLKSLGFYQLQKSVYIKKLYNIESKNRLLSSIHKILPNKGDVRLIIMTNKQFSSTFHLLGDQQLCEKIFVKTHAIIEL